jgi:riboflavin synthase
MFTGIIEQNGRVDRLLPQAGGARLSISPDKPMELGIGESLSVSGACLSLAAAEGSLLAFDLGEETLRRTTLGALKPGDLVNLERALKVGDRLGGHFVSGHVDGVGRIAAVRRSGTSAEYDFEAPKDLMPYIAQKGSIAVDGVSLTPFRPSPSGFTVSLIPLTLAATTLGFKGVGDSVNLEVDLLARYVKQIMGSA